MSKNLRKLAVIGLVAAFGILLGLNLKDLIDANFVIHGNTKLIFKPIMYFSLMLVMFYEWIKILKQEKKHKNL